jgi:tungstate transport system substrate-binding protein
VAVAALKKIYDAKAPFISRGDNLGRSSRTDAVAEGRGGSEVAAGLRRERHGMGQTLTIADQRRAYTISDRATYLAFGQD